MDDEPKQDVYFIGIALPEPLNRQIAELKWELKNRYQHLLKPVLPHVTLLHPPSLQGIMPSELVPKVREVAKKYLPLTIALQEIDFFDGTVCYIQAQSRGLDSLQSQLVKLLPPEAQRMHYKRAYVPHVTLAQIYEPGKLARTDLRRTIKERFELPLQFTVSEVTCFTRIMPREYRPESI